MRDVTEVAQELIESDVRMIQWVVDLFYNGQRVEMNVPIIAPRLDWDGKSQIQGTGSVTVVWADKHGRSRAPQGIGDWFAPFGSELQIDCVLQAGSFSERIPLGRFQVTNLPRIEDRRIPWVRGHGPVTPDTEYTELVTATVLNLEVRDLMNKVGRNRFALPESPASQSAWDEVQRLTSMPLLRNVPDATVPPIVYADSRLDTLDSLFDLMQAWPHLTSFGQITARPYAWPDPVDVVLRPRELVRSLDSENIYNRVVVEGKAENGEAVRAVADITSGPLRTTNSDGSVGPYGVVTYFYSSDYITEWAQAQRTANNLLSEVSQARGVIASWEEPFNPRREVGDVVWLGPQLVRIIGVSTDGATTSCSAEVAAG